MDRLALKTSTNRSWFIFHRSIFIYQGIGPKMNDEQWTMNIEQFGDCHDSF